MPSVMHSILTSYGVGRNLLAFFVMEIKNVVQLLAQAFCLSYLP